MSSRRMITGDIWEDDFFNTLCHFARLLWVGLITGCADDQGRLQDNILLICHKIFPMENIPVHQAEDALNSYAEAGKIVRYTANGKKLIQITNWWKHQTPRWAGKSNYPPPEGWTDRERYHTTGNKIVEKNWKSTGGYIANCTGDYIAGYSTNDVNVNGDDEYIAPTAQESEPPEPEQQPKVVKNQGAYAALLQHEQARANGKPDLSWLTESLRPLAEVFITETKIYPLQAEHSFWQKSFMQMWEVQISPRHLKRAIRKMTDDGLVIKSPESVKAVARDLRSKEDRPDPIRF